VINSENPVWQDYLLSVLKGKAGFLTGRFTRAYDGWGGIVFGDGFFCH
jgi:hypothetical protein